jgi:hypothetical protein
MLLILIHPSTREDSMEGRMDLVQAVVADQGFIAKLSSTIMAQMAPQLTICVID